MVKVRSFVPLAVLAAFLLSLGAWPAAMAADDGLSISGRLSGSAGNLGGIAISGCTTDWSFCSETATTDDEGNFTLGSLAAGAYILTVQTGPTYIWGYYQGPGLTQDFSAATPVDVTGGSVSLPEVDLSVAFSISGGVTGAAGGLGSLDISACLVGSMGCMSEAWPDAAGNYSLAGLAPGTYQVSMRDQNHVYVSGLYTGNGLTHEFSDATEITVTDANVVLPSFEVPLGVSVRGTVTGDAGNLAGITMSASEDDFGTGSYGETHPDAAGNFVIGGLWPGDYRIRIEDYSQTYVAGTYTPDGIVQSDVPHMTVGPDGLDLGVIPLELASSIHGTVSGYAGPIGWINVDACRDDGLCFEGLSDDNGTFSVPGIAPGSYVLSFRDWSGTFATGYYSDSGIVDYAFLATPITVPPSPAALSVTLRRSGGGVPGAPLSVVAVAGDGSADVTWAPPLDNGGYQIYQYAVTASNGEVCFSSGTECPFVDLTNGESYTFTVVASNMAGDSRPSAPSEPVTPMAPPPVPVAVRLGVSASATSVTAGGSVTLTVSALDQNSNLVPDYQGTVTLSCASGWCSLPDPYTFTMDDAGVHQFTVNLGTAGQQAIHVDDGVLQAGDAVVTVKPGPTVTLNVTGPQTTTAGVQGRFSISCTDVYGNVTTDFTGKVKLQRSDPSMAGPNSVQIVKGHGQFKATFKTAGDQWIAVSNAGATAFGMAYVHVNSAAAFRLVIGGVAARSVDGAPISLTVTAVDRFGNVATGYDGTVRFTSNDRVAGLPAGYKFTTQDSGVHAFTVILRTPGRRWVKVKDTSKHPLGDVARVLVTRT